jgi:hypothetical protein
MRRLVVLAMLVFIAANAHADRGKDAIASSAKPSGKSKLVKKATEREAPVATPERPQATKANPSAATNAGTKNRKADGSSGIRKVVVAKFTEPEDVQARNTVLEVFSEHNDIEVIGFDDAEVVAKRLGADLGTAKGRTAVSKDLGIYAWVDGKVSGSFEAQIDLTDSTDRRLTHARLSGASAQILASVIRTELWRQVGPAISDQAKLARNLETQRKLAREKLIVWQKELDRQRKVAEERQVRRQQLLVAEKTQAGEKLRAWNNELVRQQQVVRDRRLAQAQEQKRRQEEQQRKLVEMQRQQALEQQRRAAAEQAARQAAAEQAARQAAAEQSARQAAAEQTARQAAAEQAARQAALQQQWAAQPRQVYQLPGVYPAQRPAYPQPAAPTQPYPVVTQPAPRPVWQIPLQPVYPQPAAPTQPYPVVAQPAPQPVWQIPLQPTAASGQTAQYSLPQRADTTEPAAAKNSRAKKHKKK